MFTYSVITPTTENEQHFFIIPLEKEMQFVDPDCDSGDFEYARLDLMLEILNGYQKMPHGAHSFETEHFTYSRNGLGKDIIAEVRTK